MVICVGDVTIVINNIFFCILQVPNRLQFRNDGTRHSRRDKFCIIDDQSEQVAGELCDSPEDDGVGAISHTAARPG